MVDCNSRRVSFLTWNASSGGRFCKDESIIPVNRTYQVERLQILVGNICIPIMDSVWSDGSLKARTGALHSDNRCFPVLLNHSDMHTCNLDLTLFIEVFIIGQLPCGMGKR